MSELGKCLWVKGGDVFERYHGILVSSNSSRQVILKNPERNDRRRMARKVFSAYKKKETERRRRYNNHARMEELAKDKKYDLHKCEICKSLFLHVNLFWGFTLCNDCYLNPANIVFILKVKYDCHEFHTTDDTKEVVDNYYKMINNIVLDIPLQPSDGSEDEAPSTEDALDSSYTIDSSSEADINEERDIAYAEEQRMDRERLNILFIEVEREFDNIFEVDFDTINFKEEEDFLLSDEDEK